MSFVFFLACHRHMNTDLVNWPGRWSNTGDIPGRVPTLINVVFHPYTGDLSSAYLQLMLYPEL